MSTCRIPPPDRDRPCCNASPRRSVSVSSCRLYPRGERIGSSRGISGHNYWLWGPGDRSYDVVIIVGVPKASLEGMFGEVVEAGRTSCEYTDRMSRNDAPVYVCREPKLPIAEVWARGKDFI